MTFRERLISVASAYADALGISLKTTSVRAFNESKVMANLMGGGSVTIDRADRAIQWFSDNWPEGAFWPEGVERPEPRPAEDAA